MYTAVIHAHRHGAFTWQAKNWQKRTFLQQSASTLLSEIADFVAVYRHWVIDSVFVCGNGIDFHWQRPVV